MQLSRLLLPSAYGLCWGKFRVRKERGQTVSHLVVLIVHW